MLSKRIKSPKDSIVLSASIIITLVVGLSFTPLLNPLNNIAQNVLSTNSTVEALTASQPPLQPLTRGQLIDGVNKERAKAGVPPLSIDGRLNGSAQFKANDMEKRGYYDHADPDGKQGYTLALAAMPQCSYVSESLAGDQTAEKVISDWMGSKPHREAMLDPGYSLTGFGIVEHKTADVDYWYVVEHFCEVGKQYVAPKASSSSSAYVPFVPTTLNIPSTPTPSYSYTYTPPTPIKSIPSSTPSAAELDAQRQAKIQSCLSYIRAKGAGGSSAEQQCYSIR